MLRDRNQKDKIYSLHKPHTTCIAKGKSHQMYEFGNKVGLICTAKTQVVLAIRAFPGNPNDGHTIEPLIGYLKSDCRMERNYLWEEVFSTMNVHLSGAAWNLKKYMKKLKRAFLVLIFLPLRAAFLYVITPFAHTTIPCEGRGYSANRQISLFKDVLQ